MAKIEATYGTVENFVSSALMGLGATETDANGRYYLDGNMVNAELSDVIAEAIYIQEIFRDGQSVTGKYTTDRKAGAVRVLLDTPLPFSSRTVSFGGRNGTAGNAGVINVNPPMLPANDEFMIYLNQVNDQSMLFPDLSKEYLPLDVMAKKIAGYAKSVVQDRSASTLAEILAYAFYRAMNGGDNLFAVEDLKADNAYATLCASLNSALDNGDSIKGAFTFATEGRTIIGRPSFINGVFNRQSGIILNGSDLAQEMLKNYDLDVRMSDRSYVGTGYKGYALGFHWQSAPDYIWSLAEKYLGLSAGALANVNAIAVSFESTAMGRVVDLGVKLIDANEVRGLKAQPLNVWGHEAFRKSLVIGGAGFDTTALEALGFTAETRVYPVAPKDVADSDFISVPVYGEDGTVVAFKKIAQVPQPNGDNIQSGVKTVADIEASVKSGAVANPTSVTLTTTTPNATIYYTTNGDTPTAKSTKYSAAISITKATTIKAIAVAAGQFPSNVATFEYTIKG